MLRIEDDLEDHHSQRNLALEAIDDLMMIKLQLLDAGKKVPAFVNNSISYLKRKYVTEEKTISDLLIKRGQFQS